MSPATSRPDVGLREGLGGRADREGSDTAASPTFMCRLGNSFGAAVLLAAFMWLPTVATPPPAQGAVCTGWSSTSTPPPAIRVLRKATGVVQTVDFETYVKVVMAAEWPPTWPIESLRAGAVTVKQYAWYYAMHYRGGTGTGGCYDVVDNSNDQIYAPETYTPAVAHIQSVESTWPETITKNGSFILTGYRPGSDVPCASDADGAHLYQHSARRCALDLAKTGEQILQIYFDPGMSIQGAPTYAPTTYHALTPARILDTRNGMGLAGGALVSHVARTFAVTGQGGVPAGATAVTGNLTVTGQTSPGYLFIGPNATNNPTSSTLNFPVGDDRANGVTVALGAGGTLSLTYVATAGATAHAIFDVSGYFTPDSSGSTYHAVSPARLLDTRNGTGGISGPLSSHVARSFSVTGGESPIPAGATAVTGNLTVTGQTSPGYLFIGPVATNDPTSSTLNFPVRDDRANNVTVALGTGGVLGVTFVAPSPGNSAHVIFDVTGYFTADATGSSYVPLSPARILDTRYGIGGLSSPFVTHVARSFGVTGAGGVPTDADAVTGNLTVTGQTSPGYLFIGPDATNDPTSSTLNFPAADNRANGVTAALGTGGVLWVTFVAPTGGNSAQAIFDVTGYFQP